MATVLFACRGTLYWTSAWLFLALMIVCQVPLFIKLSRASPDLIEERKKIQPGSKRWDKFLVITGGVLLPLVTWVVAGLDRRFDWTPPVGLAAQIAGFAVSLAGYLIVAKAMFANRFFAVTVRIQTDRGHTVIDSGPYAVVRHPGYAGILLYNFAAPVALGSWMALAPAGAAGLLFLVRTVLEDRTLQKELAGYTEYAQRVRYKLIPGVW
jgi:protein-S-isoprenylcysteine O-methyltransferase Ste14